MDKIVNIGQSIHIKGELSGNEDLTIEGKVEGKVYLKDHNLTIGSKGKLIAGVHAKTVMVLGEVNGNIIADDKVEVAATGMMRGDIQAPRVVLADGAKFKGAIDMDPKKPATTAYAQAPAAQASTNQPATTPTPAQPVAATPAQPVAATPAQATRPPQPVGAGSSTKG